tara:strand:+ start:1463 stop:1696 length:234 start_codon:yes stop_codon:yes gene_type:complete
MTLGDVLKTQREKQQLSRYALGKIAEVSESTIYRIESNKYEPQYNVLKRIVGVLQGKIEVKFNDKNDEKCINSNEQR